MKRNILMCLLGGLTLMSGLNCWAQGEGGMPPDGSSTYGNSARSNSSYGNTFFGQSGSASARQIEVLASAHVQNQGSYVSAADACVTAKTSVLEKLTQLQRQHGLTGDDVNKRCSKVIYTWEVNTDRRDCLIERGEWGFGYLALSILSHCKDLRTISIRLTMSCQKRNYDEELAYAWKMRCLASFDEECASPRAREVINRFGGTETVSNGGPGC